MGLALRGVREAAAAAGHAIPTNASGTEYCLSYHVAGFCWDNCRRSEDHRNHTPAEKKTLSDWTNKCYRAGGPI